MRQVVSRLGHHPSRATPTSARHHRARLHFERALQFAAEMAEGLAYLHYDEV